MSSVKIVFLFILVLLGAVYIGIGAASDQLQTLAILAGAVTVGVCLIMGRNIWMLIPLMTYIQLTLYLPGRPSTLLVAQLLVTLFGILMIMSGKLRAKFKMTSLEWWMVIFFLSVAQVYARNPVGINLLGAGNVGGKPYLMFCVGLVAAVILASIKVPYKDLVKIFKLTVIGSIINFVLGAIGYYIPTIGQYIGAARVESEYSMVAVDSGRAGRVPFVIRLGPNIALIVSSMINPLRAAFKVLWLPLILIAFASAGISGYRNVIVSTGLTFIVGIIYQDGIRSLIISVVILVLALGAVSVINIAHPLPPNVQRAMSFLPGTWEEEYIDDANSSSDWRFEMWEEALFSENWIKNKIMGDGLGFTSEELAYQEELRLHGSAVGGGGFDSHRETALVNGDYHSGPVSAIRTIGYVGLIVMLLCMLVLAFHAHRLIKRSKNMPWRPVVMIVCIPLMWYPLFFLFVFGSFAKDAVIILMGYGMIRLLENNLPFDKGVDIGHEPDAL